MTLAAHYASALVVLEKGKNASERRALVDVFIALLRRKGHHMLLPSIMREYRRIAEEKEAHSETTVTLAREKDAVLFKKAIADRLSELGADEKPTVAYDETLVGGFRIRHGGTLVDESYKTQLLSLYQRMILA